MQHSDFGTERCLRGRRDRHGRAAPDRAYERGVGVAPTSTTLHLDGQALFRLCGHLSLAGDRAADRTRIDAEQPCYIRSRLAIV